MRGTTATITTPQVISTHQFWRKVRTAWSVGVICGSTGKDWTSRGARQRAKLSSGGCAAKGSSVYLTEDGIERTDDSHDVGDKMTANHSVEGLKIHEGRGPNPDAVGLRRAIADDVVAKDAFR